MSPAWLLWLVATVCILHEGSRFLKSTRIIFIFIHTFIHYTCRMHHHIPRFFVIESICTCTACRCNSTSCGNFRKSKKMSNFAVVIAICLLDWQDCSAGGIQTRTSSCDQGVGGGVWCGCVPEDKGI